MDILAVSVWLRYLALAGENFSFPTNAYRGEYVIEIARALHCHPREILGTPGYLPPEQADGRSRQADERSDVWAVGVMAYELLTGRRPVADAERAVEAMIGAPVSALGVGPRRDQTVQLRDVL